MDSSQSPSYNTRKTRLCVTRYIVIRSSSTYVLMMTLALFSDARVAAGHEAGAAVSTSVATTSNSNSVSVDAPASAPASPISSLTPSTAATPSAAAATPPAGQVQEVHGQRRDTVWTYPTPPYAPNDTTASPQGRPTDVEAEEQQLPPPTYSEVAPSS